MIQIGEDLDKKVNKESRPVDYFWSFEKNMFQVISEDIINMFGTMAEFSNLIGTPVEMFRKDYKSLEKTEPNAPRFMDIAGKALGYIGVNQDSRPHQTLNVLQIMTGKETRDELLARVRKRLTDDSGQ